MREQVVRPDRQRVHENVESVELEAGRCIAPVKEDCAATDMGGEEGSRFKNYFASCGKKCFLA